MPLNLQRDLESGTLRHRVQIWSPNVTQNEAGQEVESPAQIFGNLPASVETVGGDEERRGDQMVAGATHLIITRFLIVLETTPDLFIVQPRFPPGAGAAKRMDVLRTTDPDGTRRRLHHYCKEVPLANSGGPEWQT